MNQRIYTHICLNKTVISIDIIRNNTILIDIGIYTIQINKNNMHTMKMTMGFTILGI